MPRSSRSAHSSTKLSRCSDAERQCPAGNPSICPTTCDWRCRLFPATSDASSSPTTRPAKASRAFGVRHDVMGDDSKRKRALTELQVGKRMRIRDAEDIVAILERVNHSRVMLSVIEDEATVTWAL